MSSSDSYVSMSADIALNQSPSGALKEQVVTRRTVGRLRHQHLTFLFRLIRINYMFQTVDHSARVSMKNAASCDNFCELQTHRTLIFRTDIPALGFTSSASFVRGSFTYHGTDTLSGRGVCSYCHCHMPIWLGCLPQCNSVVSGSLGAYAHRAHRLTQAEGDTLAQVSLMRYCIVDVRLAWSVSN